VGLSMPERRAVSKQMARRYAKASKQRPDAGRAVRADRMDPAPRDPGVGPGARSGATAAANTQSSRLRPEVLEPLRLVWAMLNGPAGKRLAEVTEARLFFETLDERMETLRRLLPCPNCGSTDLAVKPVLDVPE
jgi:hypothetical protein